MALILTILLLIFPKAASAANPFFEYLGTMATKAGYDITASDETTLSATMGLIVFMLLTFVGVIFTGLTIYGGMRWMLARGNESEVEKAKSIIKDSLIGLIITIASYSIWAVIARVLLSG